jgi:hypothetical protein
MLSHLRVVFLISALCTAASAQYERAAITGTVRSLPLGSYTFAASHDGFAETRVTDVRISVGQTRTIDVMLNLGDGF